MDPNVKSSIEQRLIESGEKERLKVMQQVKKSPIDMNNTKAVIFGPTKVRSEERLRLWRRRNKS